MKYPLLTDFEDDDFHLAHAGPFVLMNWRGHYSAASFHRIEAVHHRLAERRREDITGVSVVEAGSPIPGEEARLAGADMMTRTYPTTKAVVIVFLDRGFVASALQSVAARVLSLGGRVPMKFFRDIHSAGLWLPDLYPHIELSAADLEELLFKLRTRYSPSRIPAPPASEPSHTSLGGPLPPSSHPPASASVRAPWARSLHPSGAPSSAHTLHPSAHPPSSGVETNAISDWHNLLRRTDADGYPPVSGAERRYPGPGPQPGDGEEPAPRRDGGGRPKPRAKTDSFRDRAARGKKQ